MKWCPKKSQQSWIFHIDSIDLHLIQRCSSHHRPLPFLPCRPASSRHWNVWRLGCKVRRWLSWTGKVQTIWSIKTHWNSLKDQNMTDDWFCLGGFDLKLDFTQLTDPAKWVLEDYFRRKMGDSQGLRQLGRRYPPESKIVRWRILELNGHFNCNVSKWWTSSKPHDHKARQSFPDKIH